MPAEIGVAAAQPVQPALASGGSVVPGASIEADPGAADPGAADPGAADPGAADPGAPAENGVRAVAKSVRTSAPPQQGVPIALTLRSTPPGAEVAVNGELIGRTPALWEGVADGQPMEFMFVLPGHARIRYRFVPTTSGVVHGSLMALTDETADDRD